jgi:hypothetical protein
MAKSAGPVSVHGQAAALNKEASEKQRERLSQRFGKHMEDWASTTVFSIYPDLVSRRSVIYVTRAQARDLFEIRDRMVRAEKDLDRELVDFFARLP